MDVYTAENKNFYKVVKTENYDYLKNNIKISDDTIYEIREKYNNHYSKSSVYENYKDCISESYFDKIWNGAIRKYIHMDVYTAENKDYQRKQSISVGSADSKFSDDEILYYRRRHFYEGISIMNLYKEYLSLGNDCIYNTFYTMIVGYYYKRIPKPPIKFVNKNN